MKFSWNVVQKTMAVAICSGLLAACQDRGSFEARVFSDAEKKNFCSKSENTQACIAHGLIADPAKAQLAQNNNNLPSPDATLAPKDNSKSTPVTPQAPPAPPVTSGPKPTPSADQDKKTNLDASKDQADKAPKVKPLTVTEELPYGPGAEPKVIEEYGMQEEMIKRSKTDVLVQDQEASKLVKGINISITGSASKLLLNIEALVMIGGDDLQKLIVKDAEISFNKDGKLNEPVQAILENPLSPEKQAPAGHSLYVSGLCSNETCDVVYVRLDFRIGTGRNSGHQVVFALDKATGYDIEKAQSSHPQRISFEKAKEEFLTPAAPTEPAKEKVEDKAKADPSKDTSAPGATAPAAPKEAPAKEAAPAAKAGAFMTLANGHEVALRTVVPQPAVKTTKNADGKVERVRTRPGMKKDTAPAVPSKEPLKAASAPTAKMVLGPKPSAKAAPKADPSLKTGSAKPAATTPPGPAKEPIKATSVQTAKAILGAQAAKLATAAPKADPSVKTGSVKSVGATPTGTNIVPSATPAVKAATATTLKPVASGATPKPTVAPNTATATNGSTDQKTEEAKKTKTDVKKPAPTPASKMVTIPSNGLNI